MHILYVSLLILGACLQLVNGQQVAFSFTNSTLLANDQGLSECESFGVELLPLSENSSLNAVSPFYMFSFELGGIARSDFLGTNAQNLTWQVRHSQGTRIAMYILDGAGNISTLDSSIVQSGNTSNCHPTQSSSDITVSADTSQVSTCDDLTTTITGGTKPYTVTVVGVNVTRNYTLDANDDGFDYVNQVSPGNSFLIAASDSKGEWAIGTNFLNSVGSADTSCPGQESSGTASGSKSSSNKGAVIGGVIGGIIFLLLAAGLAAYFYFKLRKDTRLSATNRKTEPFDHDDVSPYVLAPGAGLQMQSIFTPSYAPSSSGPTTGPLSDTSDVPMLRSPYPVRNATTMSGEQIMSHSGSIYYGTPSDALADGYNPRCASPDNMAGESSRLVGIGSAPPMTEKERVRAREEERRKQTIVQHEDAEDILDVPPMYRERTGGPSGSSAV